MPLGDAGHVFRKMKQLFLTLLMSFLTTIPLLAQMPQAKVTTIDGQFIKGSYLMRTDSTITIRVTSNVNYFKQKYGTDVITLPISEIALLNLEKQDYQPMDGELVLVKKTELQGVKMGDPAQTIGRALKSTGSTAIAVGIPVLISGVACLAAGQSMLNKDSIKSSKLNLAGSVLLPVGASLTIIGIPLYAHGKKIMQMNFVYTGNGAGISMNL